MNMAMSTKVAKQVIEIIRSWCTRNNVSEDKMKTLLRELMTVDGNQSYKKTMVMLVINFK